MAGYDARSPLAFIVLVFVLTVPFWAIGAVVPRELLPGLPLSALAAACPAVAAAILVWRAEGSSGVRALLARAFDFGRISAPVWYLVIFLLAPAIMATAYLAMRVLGWPLPAPAFDLPMFPVLVAAFFIFGLG